MNKNEAMRIGLDPTDEVDVEALIAQATAADGDSEVLLKELMGVQGLKTYWANGRGYQGYERLRDKAVAVLEGQGVKYFIGRDGAKWYAVVSKSDQTEVDEELLLQLLVEREDCDEELLDEVMPRSVSKEGLKRAHAAERLPSDIFARVVSLKPRASHVEFHRAEDPE